MISYENAKKIALELNGDVNSCYEYDNAYNFFDKNEVGAGDLSLIHISEPTRPY